MLKRLRRTIQDASNSPGRSGDGGNVSKSPSRQEGNETSGFICPMCMAGFKNPTELQIHFDKVHNDNDDPPGPEESNMRQEISSNDSSRASNDASGTQNKFEGDDNKAMISTEGLHAVSVKGAIPGGQENEGLQIDKHESTPKRQPKIEGDAFEQEISDLEASLQEEKWYSKELKLELDKVQEKAQMQRNELELVQQQMAIAITTNENLAREREGIAQKLAMQSQELVRLQSTCDELKTDREAQREVNKNQSTELEKAAMWVRDLESQIMQRPGADDVLVLKKELISVQTLMDQLTLDSEKQKEEVTNKYKQLEKEEEELRTDYNNLQSEHSRLRSDQMSSEQKLEDTLQKTATDSTMLNEMHLSETDKIREDVSNLKLALEKERMHSQRVEVESNNLQEECLDVKSELEKTKRDLDEKVTEFENSKTKLDNLESQFLNMKNIKTETQKKLESVLLQLEDACKDKELSSVEKNARIETLTLQLEELKSDHAELMEERNNLLSVRSTLENQCKDFKEAFNNAEMEKNLGDQKHDSVLTETRILLKQSTTSNSQLQERVQELEAEIRQFWDKMQEERSSAHEKLMEKEKQIMQMQLIQENVKEELQQEKEFRLEKESKLDSNKSLVQEITEKSKKLADENVSLSRDLESVRKMLAETDTRVSGEASKKEEALEEVRRLQQERSELLAKMEVGEGQTVIINQLTDENASLRKNFEEKEAKIQEEKLQYENIVKEYENSLNECKVIIKQYQDIEPTYQCTISDLEERVASSQEKNSKLAIDLDEKAKQGQVLQEIVSGQKVDYEGQISLLRQSLEDRTRECDKLTAAFETLKATNESALGEAEKSRVNLQSQIDNLQEEKYRYSIQIKEYQGKTEQKLSELRELQAMMDDGKLRSQQELENLKLRHAEKLASLDSQLKVSSEKNISAKVELESLQMQYMDTEASFAETKRQLDSSVVNLEESAALVVTLRKQMDEIRMESEEKQNSMRKTIKDGAHELESVKKNHEDSIRELKTQFDDEVEKMRKQKREEEEQHQGEVKNLQAELNMREDSLGKKDEEILTLKNSLSGKDSDLGSLSNRIKIAEEKLEATEITSREHCSELQGQIEQLNTEKGDMAKQMKTRDEIICTHESTINKAKEKADEQDVSLRQAYAELGKACDNLKAVTEKHTAACEELNVIKLKVDSSGKDIARLSEENSVLTTSLEMSNVTIDKLAKDLERKNTELISSQSSLKETAKELCKTKEILASKQEEWNGAKVNLDNEVVKWKDDHTVLEIKFQEEASLRSKEKEAFEDEKEKLKNDLRVKESRWNGEREELLQSQATLKGAQQILITAKMELQKKLESASIQLNDERERYDKMELALQKEKSVVETEFSDLKKKVESTREKMLQIQEEKQRSEDRLQLEVSTLRDNLDSVRGEWQVAIQQVDKVNKDMDELKGQIVVMQATVQNNADERRALLERCILAEQQVEQMEANEQQIKRRLEDAQAAMHELGRENQAMQVKNSWNNIM